MTVYIRTTGRQLMPTGGITRGKGRAFFAHARLRSHRCDFPTDQWGQVKTWGAHDCLSTVDKKQLLRTYLAAAFRRIGTGQRHVQATGLARGGQVGPPAEPASEYLAMPPAPRHREAPFRPRSPRACRELPSSRRDHRASNRAPPWMLADIRISREARVESSRRRRRRLDQPTAAYMDRG